MICPACGQEVPELKFCVNCGTPLEGASQETVPLDDSATAPVGEAGQLTQPVEQPTAPLGLQAEEVPESAWQAQPQQVCQVGQTLEMPAQQQSYQPDQTMQMPAQPSSGGGYVPPAGAPQAPYQQGAPYRGQSGNQGNQAPSSAFVLAIVGLILSILFVTFLPGVVCSIIALVLNAGYGKRGLSNPHKTSTMVLGIIGIVVAALCLITSIAIGAVAAQLIEEVDRQGIDLMADNVEITTDSDGRLNITVTDPSGGAAASGSSAGASSGDAGAEGASSAASAFGSYDDAKYHDSEWNPSLYALLELTGAELSDLLEDYNFYWDDGYEGWSASDGSLFVVNDASGALAQGQIAALPKGAVGKPVVMGLWAEGYATPSSALAALAQDVAVEDSIADDEMVFAIVSGPSKVRYLMFAEPSSAADDEQALLLFTEEAISSGLFADLTGVDLGSSIDEVWKTLTTGDF